jgi:hypothetical protein
VIKDCFDLAKNKVNLKIILGLFSFYRILNLGLILNVLLISLPTSAQGISGALIRAYSNDNEGITIKKGSGQLPNGCDEIKILKNQTYILSCGGTTSKVLPNGDLILEDGTILKLINNGQESKDEQSD